MGEGGYGGWCGASVGVIIVVIIVATMTVKGLDGALKQGLYARGHWDRVNTVRHLKGRKG
jgi:hypothetical protein